MKVALEPFARTCIESVFGDDIPAGTEAAVRYYTNRLESERQPQVPTFLVPTFLWEEEIEAQPGTDVEFELTVPAEIEARLAAEARRNEVPLGRIVDHAVFIFAAELEAAVSAASAKEAKTSPRYRVHAQSRLQTAATRLAPAGNARARGCDGDRGGRTGSGAS